MDEDFNSIFTEKVKCECGYIFSSILLKDDTPICCPWYKTWSRFKEIRLTKNKKKGVILTGGYNSI